MGSVYRVLYEYQIRKNKSFLIKQIEKRIIHHNDVFPFIAKHNYWKAIEEMERSKKVHSFEYAYCLQSVGRQEEATTLMKELLEEGFDITVEQIIAKINDQIYSGIDSMQLEYHYYGGFGNYGFITHSDGNEIKRITKIQKKECSKREIAFFSKHLNNLESASSFIPRCYSIMNIEERLSLITMQYILPKQVRKEDEDSVIRICTSMSHYSISDFYKNCENPNDLYRGNDEVGNLHKRITLLMMREKMIKNLDETPDTLEIKLNLKRLFKKILSKKCYKKVIPQVHYSFCHNDFHRKNMYTSGNSVYVFDWSNYQVGLKGWDMCYFWGNYEQSFGYIKERYIENIVHIDEGSGEIIWRVFFTFLLIYVWIDRLHKNSAGKYIDGYFMPAFEYINAQLDKL